MKGECGKLIITHVHRLNLADTIVHSVLANDKYGLSLVLQLCTDMTTRIVVILVQMEDCMDMKLVNTRPSHEYGHHISSLLAIVDVIHEVSKSVYDYKTDFVILSQSIVNDSDTQLRCIFSQSPKHQTRIILFKR